MNNDDGLNTWKNSESVVKLKICRLSAPGYCSTPRAPITRIRHVRNQIQLIVISTSLKNTWKQTEFPRFAGEFGLVTSKALTGRALKQSTSFRTAALETTA